MPDLHNILVSNDFTDMEYKKKNVLSLLGMARHNLDKISEKLNKYKYVNSLLLLNVGSYIRWIPIKGLQNNRSNVHHELKLTNGGIVISVVDINGKIYIKCKNNCGNIYQLTMTYNIIFQKLTEQEQVIMEAMQVLKK